MEAILKLLANDRFMILYGVIIGWILNSFSSYFRFRTHRNVKLGKVIFQMSQLNDEIRNRNRQMDIFSEHPIPLTDIKKFEEIRKNAHKPFKKIEPPVDLLIELAEFEPFYSYILKGMLEDYQTMVRMENAMLAGYAEVADEKEYFETYLMGVNKRARIQDDVQHVMDKLCWKFGPMTYLNMKFKIAHTPLYEKPFSNEIKKYLKQLPKEKRKLNAVESEKIVELISKTWEKS
jgi:hypothetical protein